MVGEEPSGRGSVFLHVSCHGVDDVTRQKTEMSAAISRKQLDVRTSERAPLRGQHHHPRHRGPRPWRTKMRSLRASLEKTDWRIGWRSCAAGFTAAAIAPSPRRLQSPCMCAQCLKARAQQGQRELRQFAHPEHHPKGLCESEPHPVSVVTLWASSLVRKSQFAAHTGTRDSWVRCVTYLHSHLRHRPQSMCCDTAGTGDAGARSASPAWCLRLGRSFATRMERKCAVMCPQHSHSRQKKRTNCARQRRRSGTSAHL